MHGPLAGLLLGMSCGAPEEVSGGGVPFGVTAGPLSGDTQRAVFALGRSADFQPHGGEGLVALGAATLPLRDVPEGRFQARFAGYAAHTFTAPNPSTFPGIAWCLRDTGDGPLSVVTGQRGRRTLSALPTPLGCTHAAVDRFAVDPDYSGDASHPFFGSPHGHNVAAIFLDDWGAQAPLRLDLDTGGAPPPFGVFSALPDTAGGATWPEVAAWNSGPLALTADGAGDAQAFLVVRPGALPVLWEIGLTATESGESTQLRVWVEGAPSGPCSPADCSDGVDCTADHCDLSTVACVHTPDDLACDDNNDCTSETCTPSGCVYTAVADGTACGAGLLCRAGACGPGVLLYPIGPLTGDCANDGAATTSFAQMRIGNDRIAGTPPLEVQRYAALSFDLSAVPNGQLIDASTMYVYQERVDGDGPYQPGGLERVVAEQVYFTMLFGGCDTWVPFPGTIGQAPVSDSAALGWKSADVTAAVQHALLAGPRQVQLRLRFVPNMADGDGLADLAAFASDNTTTPERVPFLLVHYAP